MLKTHVPFASLFCFLVIIINHHHLLFLSLYFFLIQDPIMITNIKNRCLSQISGLEILSTQSDEDKFVFNETS